MSTPYLLQDALVKEIKAIFEDFETQNAEGNPALLNVYPQNLPTKKMEDDSEHFPYVVVRVNDGGINGENEEKKCRITLVIGVYDDSPDRQGYKATLNVLQRLETHFFAKRIIDDRYRIEYPYNWTLHDEDMHPYYFGGVETNWVLPVVREEVYMRGELAI